MSVKVVHCKQAPYDVYIGRPSKWGNPFKVGPNCSRAESIAKYEDWIRSQPELMADIMELDGKTLGCWCKPLDCHGDILARLVEEAKNAEIDKYIGEN